MRPRVLFACAVAAVLASACVGHGEAADASRCGDPSAPRRCVALDIVLPPDGATVEARVSAGWTLASILRAAGVSDEDAAAAVARATDVFDPRKLKAEQPYRVARSGGGALRRFEYEIDGDRLLRVERPDRAAPLLASIVPIDKTRETAIVEGRIDRTTPSLFAAMDAAGESIDLPIALAEIFGGEIDFNVDLQPGDAFRVVVEKQYRRDARGRATLAGYGPIQAAEFDNAGRRFRAFRYDTGEGPGYFDDQGVSLRRFFLRTPLKFDPIVTSGFSRSRLHPILREYRPHLGVDYRAPVGAPVVAVADGSVVEAGMAGGAGRLVHLRHANGYESEYLHLSSIAVRAGAHVRQGELIGRVGESGLATGPHLDYRIKKNGAFVNPLTALRQLPPADPIPATLVAAFHGVRDRARRILETPSTLTASAAHHN